MRAACVAACFLAAVALAAGQDAKPEKLAFRKVAVGDKTKVKKVDVSDMTVEVTTPCETKAVRTTTTETEEYTQEVLAVADGKATKFARAYTKSRTEGNPGAVRPYENKTVTIEKVGDEYQFTVDKAELTGADAEDLDNEFNKGEELMRDGDDLLPPGPVAVGGEWALTRKVLEKFNTPTGLFTIDPAKSKVANKLTKSYAKAGTRYGVIRTAGTLAVTGMRVDENAFTLDAASTIKLDMTIDAATDGKSPASRETGTVAFKLAGDLPGGAGTIAVTGTTKVDRTVEPAAKP